MPYTKYIQNEQYYKEVLSKAEKVKEALWIGTADIKDLYVGDKPFLEVLAKLLQRGVEVRLIHAKEPGPIFREEFDRYPILFKNLERVLCPRVHFKMMIFDYREAYIGSANLTGAGIGAKGANNRNFEAGILTDEISILDAATEQFDAVWRGAHCKACLRRDVCGAPIV
jgi:phosphatidylserine/phosphatidylglycerophosphate/cardiolipin synthase-like enzyme